MTAKLHAVPMEQAKMGVFETSLIIEHRTIPLANYSNLFGLDATYTTISSMW
jgi:hypothetical protein